jgi:hypothetical protein
MRRTLLILSVYLLYPAVAHSMIEDVTFGIGTQTQFVGKVQSDEVGSTNKFEFNPYLTAAAEVSLTDNFSFYPEFGVLIPDSTRDPLVSKMTYFFLGSFGYELRDWVVRAGLGLSMTRISGDGGTQVLDNGNGQTSFPMPEGSATSRNVILNLGTEYFIHQDWSARVESSVYNPINSRNRAFTYQLAFYYHFHDLLGLKKSKPQEKKETKKEDDQW